MDNRTMFLRALVNYCVPFRYNASVHSSIAFAAVWPGWWAQLADRCQFTTHSGWALARGDFQISTWTDVYAAQGHQSTNFMLTSVAGPWQALFLQLSVIKKLYFSKPQQLHLRRHWECESHVELQLCNAICIENENWLSDDKSAQNCKFCCALHSLYAHQYISINPCHWQSLLCRVWRVIPFNNVNQSGWV